MNTELRRLFGSIETDRKVLLQRIATLSEQDFFRKPNTGKWSIAEILTHILTAERLSVVYIKKKSKGIEEVTDTGIWEELKYGIFRISQRLPLKFKAPDVVVKHTPVALNFRDLVVAWDRNRKDLEEFLESIEEKNVNRKVYEHAIAGRLGVKHALLFFKEHVRHHAPQIDRLLKQKLS